MAQTAWRWEATQRVTETNGAWGPAVTIQEDTSAFVPAEGIATSAIGVSCFNSINCTVVGADSNRQPTTDTEFNGVWEPAFEDPVPNLLGDAGFNSVSCSARQKLHSYRLQRRARRRRYHFRHRDGLYLVEFRQLAIKLSHGAKLQRQLC